MRYLALFCSALLHPLLLLNLGLASILKFHPYYQSKFYDAQFYTLTLFIAFTTFLMPVIAVYLLKRFGFVDDLAIDNPKQRLLPYSVIALLLAYAAFNLYRNDFSGLPLVFLLSTIVCIFLNILINFKLKISSHAIASGGLLGLYVCLTLLQHISVFNWLLIVSILLAGVSGWARLSLNAHTEKQVYLGYVVGLVVVLPMCYFLG
jgi:hypothetical protein